MLEENFQIGKMVLKSLVSAKKFLIRKNYMPEEIFKVEKNYT